MTDNELLFSISEIMDKKLDAKIQPLETEIAFIKNEQTRINLIIENELRSDIKRLTSIMEDEIRHDIKQINIIIDNEIRPDIKRTQHDIKQINTIIDNEIRPDIKRINIIIENEIRSDIKKLAENYLPAAKRYEKETAKMESVQTDLDVMKSVIREHSEKLQKIS